jgi:hypothetical protein
MEGNSGTRWTARVNKEMNKLYNRDSKWNLVTGTTSTRTRHGGNRRPSVSTGESSSFETTSTTNDSEITESVSDPMAEEEEESSSDSSYNPVSESDEDMQEKPPAANLIVESKALTETIERNCICSQCSGPVSASFKTITLATTITISCMDAEGCGHVFNSAAPASAKVDDHDDDYKRNTDYAINVLYVLGFISCGDGGSEAARILGLLGLPNDTTMETRSFPKIEQGLSPKLQKVTDDILLENLIEEARLSMQENDGQDANDFEQWKLSLKNETVAPLGQSKYPRLNVSFDMGWQQRSSGHKYASLSGDALLVGCHTRKPISVIVMSKVCNFCKAWENKMKRIAADGNNNNSDNNNNNNGLLEAPPHDCVRNHDGSSSAMEPKACLEMVIDMYNNKHCIIDRICCDDDASTRSLLRWSNEDYMTNNNTSEPPKIAKTKGNDIGGMIVRPNKGKLPAHIPEPVFVADPNHRKKVFTGDLWNLHKKPVANRCGLSRMDIARLGTSFGYMIRGLKRKPKEEWNDAAKAVVEHHFDDHTYCGPWCPRKNMTQQQLQQSARYYRCKTKNEELYKALLKIVGRFITPERLEEIGHGLDTQINESFNNTASWFAPKNKVYCGSQSLKNRLGMAIGISSIGLHPYFIRLFHSLGITMYPCVTHYLTIKEANRRKRQAKRKHKNSKKARKAKHYADLRKHEAQARKEQAKRDGTYQTGQNMQEGGADGYSELDLLLAAAASSHPPRPPRKTRIPSVCSFCQMRGHKTNRSKQCKFYNKKQPVQDPVAPHAEDNNNSDDERDAAVQLDRLAALQLADEDEDEDEFVDTGTWTDEEDALSTGSI